MKNIQVNILNTEAVNAAERMMVFCARLTQRGHKIKNMADLYGLLTQDYKPATVKNMVSLALAARSLQAVKKERCAVENLILNMLHRLK